MREVVDPGGRRWEVARRWTRRRVRWRRLRARREGDGRWWEALDLPVEVGELADLHPVFAVVGLVLLVVVLAVLGAFVLVPLLLGRPWEVEARTEDAPPEVRTWRVRGWSASRRAVDQVARRLAAGARNPAPDLAERRA